MRSTNVLEKQIGNFSNLRHVKSQAKIAASRATNITVSFPKRRSAKPGDVMKDSKLSRRSFLKSGSAAAAAAVGSTRMSTVEAKPSMPSVSTGTTLNYPKITIGKASRMQTNQVVNFSYPDAASPCNAIKMGAPVPGGVGPDRDIVAFSIMCTHMGCPLAYENHTKTFKCRCHYSMFDAEKNGQMICGQATASLPVITLEYNAENDTVSAAGVDGLIYGRQANIL
jgi:arsenite oxidase small subunit